MSCLATLGSAEDLAEDLTTETEPQDPLEHRALLLPPSEEPQRSRTSLRPLTVCQLFRRHTPAQRHYFHHSAPFDRNYSSPRCSAYITSKRNASKNQIDIP